MPTLRLAFASLPLTLILGCSGSSGSLSFIACSPGQLHVEGDIDGTAVSLTQSTENSGFGQSQAGGGFWMSEPFPDPTRMELTIDWAPSVVDGATADVTSATMVMPSQRPPSPSLVRPFALVAARRSAFRRSPRTSRTCSSI